MLGCLPTTKKYIDIYYKVIMEEAKNTEGTASVSFEEEKNKDESQPEIEEEN